MGGNAFNAVLSPSAFPRLHPAVYNALKVRFLPRIQNLYHFVAVPVEAPGKVTHGDVDFVVACPKSNEQGTQALSVNVPHSIVQEALGARYVNPMEGNRTSNFAVPIAQSEWASLKLATEEEDARQAAEGGEIYYQIDVNVCADKNEWDRITFFHSYGDMGMILGLIAKNAGLVLSEKGLRFPDQPNPPIELSQSFDEIVAFFGMSMDSWTDGFKTKSEIFEWVGTSRFFNPGRFKTTGEGFRKVKSERKMYYEFVEWALEKVIAATENGEELPAQRSENVAREEALDHFGKKETLEALVRERTRRMELKEFFTGHKVMDWASLGGYWKGVKLIMDGIRDRYGGDEGVRQIHDREGEEGVKKVVLQVKEELLLQVDGKYIQKPGDDLIAAMDRIGLDRPSGE